MVKAVAEHLKRDAPEPLQEVNITIANPKKVHLSFYLQTRNTRLDAFASIFLFLAISGGGLLVPNGPADRSYGTATPLQGVYCLP